MKSSDIEDEIHKRASNAKTFTERPNDIPEHVLPRSPRDVEDRPDFRYLILGPECAVTPGQAVSGEVNAFFSTTSGPNNPRTYKNALVALAPESASLSGLRHQIKRALAWQLVQKSDDAARLSEAQQKKLQKELQDAERQIAGAVQATWSVLVAADEGGTIRAELLKTIPDKQNATPFERIIHTLRESERLAPEKIDPVLLLPGSYFNLWRAGCARRCSGAPQSCDDAKLTMKALNDLPQAAEAIKKTFPDMNFEFRVMIHAEGKALIQEQMQQLNTILASITSTLQIT